MGVLEQSLTDTRKLLAILLVNDSPNVASVFIVAKVAHKLGMGLFTAPFLVMSVTQEINQVIRLGEIIPALNLHDLSKLISVVLRKTGERTSFTYCMSKCSHIHVEDLPFFLKVYGFVMFMSRCPCKASHGHKWGIFRGGCI